MPPLTIVNDEAQTIQVQTDEDFLISRIVLSAGEIAVAGVWRHRAPNGGTPHNSRPEPAGTEHG